MRYEWKLSEQALVHVLPGGGLHDLVANAGHSAPGDSPGSVSVPYDGQLRENDEIHFYAGLTRTLALRFGKRRQLRAFAATAMIMVMVKPTHS